MQTRRAAGSPVALDALERVLAPTLAESRTLPPEVYLSDDVFAWEMDRFFDRSWVCLGRADSLPGPGDQRADRAGGESVLLVRSDDGILRAFFNVCRHRGHELMPEGQARTARAIRCPYHSWAYSLHGDLAGAPRFGGVPGFTKSEFPLVPVRMAEWHGWVFVNGSGDAPELEEHVGDLESLVAPWRPEGLVPGGRIEYTVGANWKTISENYHECYHCSSIHPELCRVSPPLSGANFEHRGAWLGGWMDLRDSAQTMSLDGRSPGVPVPGLTGEQRRKVYYYGLLPNLLISLHPDYVLTHRLEPLEPGRTRVECEWLFPSEALDRPGFDPSYAVEFWDVTNREDWAAVEAVQRGLGSRGARPGPFNPSEDEVHRFMAMVARGYLDGGIDPRPERAR